MRVRVLFGFICLVLPILICFAFLCFLLLALLRFCCAMHVSVLASFWRFCAWFILVIEGFLVLCVWFFLENEGCRFRRGSKYIFLVPTILGQELSHAFGLSAHLHF